MTRAELMKYVGEKVTVVLFDNTVLDGTLGYADTFSAKHDYRKPEYFYIGNYSFKVSHTKRVKGVKPNE